MAPDDRESRSGEERFEKLLARHLRRNAPGQAGSEAAAACLDSETLAAYQEHSLSAQETDMCKQHIAACMRCREILGALEATEGIAPDVTNEKPVATGGAPVPRRAAGRKRKVYWAWLAPAGALAAGLLIWVAVHEKKPAFVEKPQPVIVAENRRASSPDDRSAVTRENGVEVLDEAKSAPKQAPQEKGRTFRSVENAAPAARAGEAASADKQVDRSAATRKDAQHEERANALRDRAAVPAAVGGLESSLGKSPAMKNAPAPAAALARVQATEQATAQEGAKIAANAAPVALPSETQTSARVTAERSAAPKQKSEVAGMAAAPPAVLAESVSGQRKKELLQSADALHANKRIIAAPGGKVQWSVGPGGAILRSADGGKSWVQQASGVTAELLAGSAPSESVCWVVGRQGTVLLTTDGEHWTKVPILTTADLSGVTAHDTRTAVVWSGTGRPRYRTEDAGGTWAPAPLE